MDLDAGFLGDVLQVLVAGTVDEGLVGGVDVQVLADKVGLKEGKISLFR